MHFTLVDLVTDIAQNAIESGADMVELELNDVFYEAESPQKSGESRFLKEFRFLIEDNGKGMTEEELKRATDPFVTDGIKHPNRKVGLGLPFLIQTAVQSNGGWDIKSEKGKGTTVTAWFDTKNVDTPPMGDVPGMLRTILMFESRAEIIIRRKKLFSGVNGTMDKGTMNIMDEYELCKSELAEALGSLEDAGSLVLLGEYLRSLEESD